MGSSTVEQDSDLDVKHSVVDNKNSEKHFDKTNVPFEVIETTKEASTENKEGFVDEIEEKNTSNKMVKPNTLHRLGQLKVYLKSCLVYCLWTFNKSKSKSVISV